MCKYEERRIRRHRLRNKRGEGVGHPVKQPAIKKATGIGDGFIAGGAGKGGGRNGPDRDHIWYGCMWEAALRLREGKGGSRYRVG